MMIYQKTTGQKKNKVVLDCIPKYKINAPVPILI